MDKEESIDRDQSSCGQAVASITARQIAIGAGISLASACTLAFGSNCDVAVAAEIHTEHPKDAGSCIPAAAELVCIVQACNKKQGGQRVGGERGPLCSASPSVNAPGA